MKYRKLIKGNELISEIGLGSGSLFNAPNDEIIKTIKTAIDNGINFFDLCAGGFSLYEPFGEAIKGYRDKIYFQLHFGAVYKDNDEYGWSRDLNLIKRTINKELELIGTDYIDFGFLHCIDDLDDYDDIISNGILDYIIELKNKGIVHHIGFSSHTPQVASKLIDTNLIDLMMFSINPAYDYEKGGEYGIGSFKERSELFSKCEAKGVNISVMKPFNGGQLLSKDLSPFKESLTKNQCLAYCLDRPGVISVVPGVRGIKDLEELLTYESATKEEKDYSIISSFTTNKLLGNCVYCNHCEPCPKGLDIGLINKYYDLALIGDDIAKNHYYKLSINANDCISCGHCNKRCPFKVDQAKKMLEIKEYFKLNI